MSELDAYLPREIARRVETVGVDKARATGANLLLLSVLAGAFISLGALFFLVVVTGSDLGLGPTRLLGGLAFSLGLVLVVVAGAELFTGNNLVAMAWASRQVSTRELLRSWGLVYLGNVVGCLGTALLVAVGGVDRMGAGAVGETALAVARAKADLGPFQALALGILCNALVCLAVWLSLAGRSVTDKILGVLFPITAFVALGFEHSIANWFFFPYAAMIADLARAGGAAGILWNLLFVTVGNVIGGTLLVAGVYWGAYVWPEQREARRERFRRSRSD